jgi:3'-5' exoribonuclease
MDVETIAKTYVKDLRERQPVHTVFKVTKKTHQTGRSGKPFLVVTLADRTGEVDARVFENIEGIEPSFLEGDYVLVKGNVITWQKRPQVVIEQIERLDPEPIDASEFQVPPRPVVQAPRPSPAPPQAPEAPRPDGSRVVGQIRELVERVHDPHVRALLLAFLDDSEIGGRLPHAPAAKGIHHAYRGGLAEHILSVMKLAHRIADHYPMADRDLLIAGALLHDIGKVKEIVPADRNGFEYTDEGRLVGHLVMTAQMIHMKASRIPNFPQLLEQHITHIVLAHHGQLEWGSPKVPMTLEALLVHYIDTIDSRVASWLEIMERDPNETWTESAKLYDRHLWKGPLPTERRRTPLDGRPGRRTRTKVRQQKAPEAKEPSLAFKPLHELAGRASAPQEAREERRGEAPPAPTPQQGEAAPTSGQEGATIALPSAEPPGESSGNAHPSES